MTPSPWIISQEERQKLIQGAFEAKKHAYCPHSKFPVGAALLTSDGDIIKGASVDNISISGNICAECSVIVKATEGLFIFRGLAIVSNVNSPISPCGICLQVIREFCALEMPILLVPGNHPQVLDSVQEDGVRETTLGKLFPDSLGPAFHPNFALPSNVQNIIEK
ncbi:cytidine deaminase-like protein [Phlegmacium glaucopus]|nr:cytidine deaminase-like protein [Phlegmacium glaucopus]